MSKALWVVKNRTSSGELVSAKKVADNWWATYHDISIFDWSCSPKCYDSDGNRVSYWKNPNGFDRETNDAAKKMVIVDRGRDLTITLERE